MNHQGVWSRRIKPGSEQEAAAAAEELNKRKPGMAGVRNGRLWLDLEWSGDQELEAVVVSELDSLAPGWPEWLLTEDHAQVP